MSLVKEHEVLGFRSSGCAQTRSTVLPSVWSSFSSSSAHAIGTSLHRGHDLHDGILPLSSREFYKISVWFLAFVPNT